MAPMNPDSNKRKKAATPSSAQRGVAKRSSHNRTNASSGTGDDGVDRISSLPNSILGFILMLLNVTEATGMAARSRTWRNVFRSPDYQLDSINDADLWRWQCRPRSRSAYLNQSNWRCGAIISLLNTRHRSSIRRFVIQQTLTSDDVMSGWLYMLFKSGIVEELVLDMPLTDPVGLWHSIFNCSSLRSLSLCNCRWPRSDVPAFYLPEWTLPCLIELTPSYMDMTSEATMDLLMRCPALLSLSLGYPRQGGFLYIQCKNLLSLTKVDRRQYFVRIVDAPKLERLLWWPVAPRITFERTITARMPRLHTIGVFQDCPFEDGVVFEGVRTISLFTNVDNLEGLYEVIKTLHHLPHLETLHIKMKDGSESENSKKLISFEELVGSPFAYLEKSVQTIVLRVNNLVRQKLAFANYLLRVAKSLRTMFIYKKRMAGELLAPEKRSSNDARIVFCDNTNESTVEFNASTSNYSSSIHSCRKADQADVSGD